MSRRVWMVAGLVGGCTSASPNLQFTDENNYEYAATLDVQTVEVQSGVNSLIDWSALSVDIRGRAVDPADIDQITLLGFDVTQQELFDLFAANDINQDDAPFSYLNSLSGETSFNLDTFETVGLVIDLPDLWIEQDNFTWLLSLMNTYGDRLDILMSAILVPTDASSNTDVVLGNDSGTLDLAADLQAAVPIVTAADKAPYNLNWTDLTTDVYGDAFDPLLGTELLIARYDLTIDEIEAQFAQLDSTPEVAKELYRMDVRGVTGADLSEAVDEQGTAFPGFTAEGTWLVGIICPTCANPAPLALGRVEVQ